MENINKAGIPASVSYSAGTYVCNNIMYAGLYLINKKYPHIRGGFIHVPFIPEQAIGKKNAPTMSVSDITKALKEAIKTIVKYKEDIEVVGGATH